MTPIELAARALCELDGNPPGATMGGKPLWQDYLPEVRAVLTAIREPSDGMIQAAADCESSIVADVYTAMIDAALSEGE
jgi:hypothetical protein